MKPLLVAYFLYHFGIPAPAPSAEPAQTQEHVSVLYVDQKSADISAVPAGGNRIPFVELHFRASCQADVAIDAIHIQRKGLGSVDDIASVYAIEGVYRLQDARQLQRDGSAVLRFRSFVVQACTERTITIAADISASAAIAGEHWFTVPRDGIETSALVRMQQQNVQRAIRSPYVSGGNTVGVIHVAYPSTLSRIRYGTDQAIRRIQLEADATSDHILQAITFTNNGTARNKDIQNIYLETAARTQVTSKISKMTGGKVRLEFQPPLRLRKNQQRNFTVRADVLVGRSKTLQFLVEEPADIEAVPTRGR